MDVYGRPWMAPRAGFQINRKYMIQDDQRFARRRRTPQQYPNVAVKFVTLALATHDGRAHVDTSPNGATYDIAFLSTVDIAATARAAAAVLKHDGLLLAEIAPDLHSLDGMKRLSVPQTLQRAGFEKLAIVDFDRKGWFCVSAREPLARTADPHTVIALRAEV